MDAFAKLIAALDDGGSTLNPDQRDALLDLLGTPPEAPAPDVVSITDTFDLSNGPVSRAYDDGAGGKVYVTVQRTGNPPTSIVDPSNPFRGLSVG